MGVCTTSVKTKAGMTQGKQNNEPLLRARRCAPAQDASGVCRHTQCERSWAASCTHLRTHTRTHVRTRARAHTQTRTHTQSRTHTTTHRERTSGLTVLQVEQACLAHVLELGARLAHLCLLEPHALTGLPPKHGEGALADLALLRKQESPCEIRETTNTLWFATTACEGRDVLCATTVRKKHINTWPHDETRVEAWREAVTRLCPQRGRSRGTLAAHRTRTPTLPYCSFVIRTYGLGPRHVSHSTGNSALSQFFSNEREMRMRWVKVRETTVAPRQNEHQRRAPRERAVPIKPE